MIPGNPPGFRRLRSTVDGAGRRRKVRGQPVASILICTKTRITLCPSASRPACARRRCAVPASRSATSGTAHSICSRALKSKNTNVQPCAALRVLPHTQCAFFVPAGPPSFKFEISNLKCPLSPAHPRYDAFSDISRKYFDGGNTPDLASSRPTLVRISSAQSAQVSSLIPRCLRAA